MSVLGKQSFFFFYSSFIPPDTFSAILLGLDSTTWKLENDAAFKISQPL